MVASNNDNGLSTGGQKDLQDLYQLADENARSAQDFELADIAREQLQKIVDKYHEDTEPSISQKLGFSQKSGKRKAADLLRKSVTADLGDLKASVDKLETEWKEKHSLVYAAFKKISGTLDDHRSILKVFPSQNDYASPLVGSVTILMKAARSHSEISIMLSKSIAEVFDKVATCSSIIVIVKTSTTRRKLAEIYGRMFQFYKWAVEWYLQSRLAWVVHSFNENLLEEFKETKTELEDSINELYREAAVANTAMVAMVNGKIASLEMEVRRQRRNYAATDVMAGQRMQKMMQATWSEIKQLESMIERATLGSSSVGNSTPSCTEAKLNRSTSGQPLQLCVSRLDPFIIDNEGPALLGEGHFWVGEKEVMFKLRAWMADGTGSRTLWISSPYESGIAVPGSRVAAMVTVAAAWQAESPVISTYGKRQRQDPLRPGLSIEQAGLISLAYSLIRQLVQFNGIDDGLCESEKKDLDTLNGLASTWEVALRLLRTLLKVIPVVTFCVIDGLNEFEWGNGAEWCEQLLDVLRERQEQLGGGFYLLFSTAGQSRLLSKHVHVRDRILATKRAIKTRRIG